MDRGSANRTLLVLNLQTLKGCSAQILTLTVMPVWTTKRSVLSGLPSSLTLNSVARPTSPCPVPAIISEIADVLLPIVTIPWML